MFLTVPPLGLSSIISVRLFSYVSVPDVSLDVPDKCRPESPDRNMAENVRIRQNYDYINIVFSFG